jgi:hemoglobin-like flavoprotein
MTPQQIQTVQSSFRKVMPIAEIAADLFYARLFELDPSLRKMFKGDMKRQGAMLMSMIASAVRGLTDHNALIPVLTALGRRHAGYGVVDAHYDTVAQALLWTLEHGLGDEFTADVRESWVAAYSLMANVMQAGARDSGTRYVALAA